MSQSINRHLLTSLVFRGSRFIQAGNHRMPVCSNFQASPSYVSSSSCFNTKRMAHSTFTIKGVHEPEYLDYLKPQIPFYHLINIQVRGYDFAVLDSYSRYLHRLANKLGLNVSKYWCAPYTTTKIDILKPESSVVQLTYELNMYERNVQIQNISGKSLSLLAEVVHRSLPVGVRLSIHEHNDKLHEETRYIPDHQLMEYQSDLKLLLSSKKYDINEEDVKKKK